MSDAYEDILRQLESRQAILFLGSGSTVNCRRATDGAPGLTGHGLAREILKELVDKDGDGTLPIPDDKVPTLMEAAEYFQSNHPGRRARLDKFVQARLKGLAPTLGHYLATNFPWKAVITTNYNTVAEDAWREATNQGFAADEVLVIRTDDEISKFAGETTKIRLYKPHGCVDLQMNPKLRMVLTSQDYAHSEHLRRDIYTAIRSLASTNTTVFVGYSLADYTFRNMYYRLFLDLGSWAYQSYAVTPMASELLFKWKFNAMAELNTTVLNTTFDVFMLNLVRVRGSLHPKLRHMVEKCWNQVVERDRPYISDLKLKNFTSIPARPPRKKRPAVKTV